MATRRVLQQCEEGAEKELHPSHRAQSERLPSPAEYTTEYLTGGGMAAWARSHESHHGCDVAGNIIPRMQIKSSCPWYTQFRAF